ncbi:GntR family transcriptional regulator [Amycolatopsis cihanbeyliensis]|uniref:DNA-binding GntR family transcriptional regulator n=1 Tax=Amycolatopsis cihanbeyliensis TaxID=1128664 RepID=A0A542DG11_AMYCI|nr:GntR family transcriptional regulator [Amycolatopsis cihanbeyliensis]TQJ02017.1 DNA-binding GntR family transcriptional regulator [Amycolatopsis cihanbeyliensis]
MPPSELPQDMSAHRINRPAPLRERVYQAMQEMIISRQLAPGQHLVESELAERLGVSRQPIREALQLLNSEGWVDLSPGYGAFVHAPTDAEVDELLAVRSVLEGESARLAAQQAGSEGVRLLKEICSRGEAAVAADDVDSMVAANAELHRAVTELSGNGVLIDFVNQVDRRVRWYYTPIARHRGQTSWEEHEKLVDAIERGDTEAAAQVMREHTERTRQSYLEQRENRAAGEQPTQVRTRRRRTGPRV